MKHIISLIAVLLFTQGAGAHSEHEITCVCEITSSIDGATWYGMYIRGKGITIAEAEENALNSCRSQTPSGGLFMVFNCLDRSLDDQRSQFFPRGDFRIPKNAFVYIKE